MSLAANLREISARTGISIPTLMNRYHSQGLRGEALEAPLGSLRRGRIRGRIVGYVTHCDNPWPLCSKRMQDEQINRALLAWKRIDHESWGMHESTENAVPQYCGPSHEGSRGARRATDERLGA